MYVRRVFAVAFAIGIAACSGAGTTEPATTCTARAEAALDSALAVAPSDVSNFSFIVERGDGHRYAYDRGLSTPNTTYESASTSKMVTAVIILRSVDKGYLHLTDHPQNYIAGWPIASTDSLSHITLAQLLSFTSGLITETPCENLPGADFNACVLAIANANAQNGKIPGREFWYASTHLQVAGDMAVKARGFSSWQDLFDEFRAETGLFPHGRYDLPSATNPRLAGGMHWTGSEYLDFLHALRSGVLLSPALQAQMLSDQRADATTGYSPALDNVGEDWHYGFGLWHECQSATWNCTAGTRVSSPGAYGAYPWWDRTTNIIGMLARQGALGSYPQGALTERAVRAKVESWAACPS